MVRLALNFIWFPRNGRETTIAIEKCHAYTGCVIPNVVGAIDGTHIEILCPDSPSKVGYFSRKQIYTINTQAVVGANLIFLDLATGFPGSIHDARMLRSSSLFVKAEMDRILDQPKKIISNEFIRPLYCLVMGHTYLLLGALSHTLIIFA